MLDQTQKITQDISRIKTVAKTLDSVGAPVPAELTTALEFAALRFDTDALTVAATTRLREARCQADLDKVMTDMAAGAAVWERSAVLRDTLKREQHGRLMDAVTANEDDLFGFFAESFEPLAGQFWTASADLPDLAAPGNHEFDRTAAERFALDETLRLKGEMDKLWTPYRQLCYVLGYIASNVEAVYALGRVKNDQAAQNAAYKIESAKEIVQLHVWKKLFPYLALVSEDIELGLNPAPRNIREQRSLISAHSLSTAPSATLDYVGMYIN